jgi:hypothetical protein
MTFDQLQPGQRVRITQTIDRRERDWQATVEGVIQAVELQKTGSWYAHAKDDKFWLRRIRLLKSDGEVSVIAGDARTQVELLA